MTFRARLLHQLEQSAVPAPDDAALDQLEAYFDLLVRWTNKINLTALNLDALTDDALDRSRRRAISRRARVAGLISVPAADLPRSHSRSLSAPLR